MWNRQKKTVLYKNIDHITKTQGFVNKVCKNGNIRIYTLGSGTKEILFKDIEKYEEWRNSIERVTK